MGETEKAVLMDNNRKREKKSKKKKKKQRKTDDEDVVPVSEDQVHDLGGLNIKKNEETSKGDACPETSVSTCDDLSTVDNKGTKKKKKKKEKKNHTSQSEISVNENRTICTSENNKAQIEEISPSTGCESSMVSAQNYEQQSEVLEEAMVKKNKKKRTDSSPAEEAEAEQAEEPKKMKEKAKKKKKGDSSESDSRAASAQICEPEQSGVSEKNKKMKKKKQRGSPPLNECGQTTTGQTLEDEQSGSLEKRKMKKKKKKKDVKDNSDTEGESYIHGMSNESGNKETKSAGVEQWDANTESGNLISADILDEKDEEKCDDRKSKKKRKRKEISGEVESIANDVEDGKDNEKPVKKKKKSKDKDRGKGISVEREDEKPDKADEKNEPVVNQWQEAQFGDTAQREKFLRLMGAYKPSTKQRSTSNYSVMAMNKQEEQNLSNSLEKQFLHALQTKKERGLGLGYH